MVRAAVEDKFALRRGRPPRPRPCGPRTAIRMVFSQEDLGKALLPMLAACRHELLMLELSQRPRRVRHAASTRILTALSPGR